ncbi:peptidoglycan-binding domain-containing protein [Priestia megaterium]|uniref:peptidoglycan-binding domain-containing protein n=1 Tax=Priestia megaterium TaxID=1404 RepID=UPI00064C843A|nr:peptidoglycan-binding domain-containing protein [Priestia megaterium]KLV29422.1 hypothetical protein ABW04_24430 [Priestia megaterium]KNH16252.1 hypothetical protein ACS78_25660 [Priestia megaterium]MCE4092697.1 peptidoglycan-binding protein [Priestia megaterium]
MKKKLLIVIPAVALAATSLGIGTPITHAASKDTNTQKIVAKSETRPTLRKGSRSAYVRDLQQSLKDAKYVISVDGTFGTQTQNVVREFQVDHNLYSDGIVGPATWAALDQNKIDRKQFTYAQADQLATNILGDHFLFASDQVLRQDIDGSLYYQLYAKNTGVTYKVFKKFIEPVK